MIDIIPFTCSVSDKNIADLHRRLEHVRWPGQINDSNWSYGIDLEYLQSLVAYWRNEFDWRKQQLALNEFDHYTCEFDGLTTHFIHQRSPHKNATPILINHGWPGSFVKFLDVIPRLTEPEKFGGNAEDAFHVVIPSTRLKRCAGILLFTKYTLLL